MGESLISKVREEYKRAGEGATRNVRWKLDDCLIPMETGTMGMGRCLATTLDGGSRFRQGVETFGCPPDGSTLMTSMFSVPDGLGVGLLLVTVDEVVRAVEVDLMNGAVAPASSPAMERSTVTGYQFALFDIPVDVRRVTVRLFGEQSRELAAETLAL
ncbi:hypothetical protein [Leekyejoonella antrihumi]|uniref:Uncharacterized protein n=1 Tax=Leekyejoonella antrihumi TaxID=1660198 RepID=A0A563DXC3_9MICO|nr:hypothetical protein [Leekyejoonella antrihumi]TWP34602.1 hypothetical protein FGL98_17065 [Leekyejoonella antrihumi]